MTILTAWVHLFRPLTTMAAALKRACLLALLLAAAAPPIAHARAPQAGQAPQAQAPPPSVQSVPTSEQKEKDQEKVDHLLKQARKAKTPEEALKLLEEALDLAPRDTVVLAEQQKVQQQIATRDGVKAEQKKQAAEATDKQKKTQQQTQKAHSAYEGAVLSRGASDLQKARNEIDAALKLNPEDAALRKFRAAIQTMAQVQQFKRIVMYVMLAVGALGGIIGALKLRPKPRSLEITEGPQEGELLPLRKKLVIIGTMESQVDWVLDDPAHRVSRRHCEISRRYRRHYVVDCSTNGTHLNGVLLQRGEPAALRPGDLITLGGAVTIRFQ
jgi:tetratricopeptide (TPR) repeat protein